MISLDILTTDTTKDAQTVWKDCLRIIKENVPQITYNTWFLPIKPVNFALDTIEVQIPSKFFWEWVDEHYNTLLNNALREVIGENAKLTYSTYEEKDEVQISYPEKQIIKETPKVIEEPKPDSTFETYLNPKYTFDNFIKGDGNQLARAAAGAISDNPGGTSFNPFFVYGGVGLGKTHLIQAIGNKVVENFPSKRVIYLSSDHFTVEFVESVQSNKVNDFSNFYRSMDVLIIDDIQFLIGKEKTQDLFFHIFNTLHQLGKQIILSSDKPPKDLKGLDDRLISRFQWGLSADIQPPDLETRIAILNKKSSDYGMNISPEILEHIATNITSNIRELEGCLIKLLATASLNSKDITLDLTKRTVKEIATNRKFSISIESITKCVCDFLAVDENKIRDKTRKKEIVLARQVAMYLSNQMTKSSLKSIGLHFGGRDHSTVIHSCRSIEEGILLDKNLKETVDSIRTKIELNLF